MIFLFSQSDVVFYDYLDSKAVSSDSPNWQAYLIKRHYLVWLRDHSTHWRGTCRYDTDDTVYADYMRASFEDFDIVRVTPKVPSSCQKYELANIRGNWCANCTAATWYLKGAFPLHIVDSSSRLGCDFDGSQGGDRCGRKRRQLWILSSFEFQISLYFKLRSNHPVLVWKQVTARHQRSNLTRLGFVCKRSQF